MSSPRRETRRCSCSEIISVSSRVTESVINDIQAKLKLAGFDSGQHSGKMTAKTCDAMKEYQVKHKLLEATQLAPIA
jgi:peptidoglycan hydrolase-like protein with peptidoglycan-binding domain